VISIPAKEGGLKEMANTVSFEKPQKQLLISK